VQVVRVNKESPAEAGGVQAGDFVLEVDGVKVATLEQFYKRVWSHVNPDDEIELTVLQGAEIKRIVIKAVDRMQTMRKPAGI
jgi:S1-C subfamily serine protease